MQYLFDDIFPQDYIQWTAVNQKQENDQNIGTVSIVFKVPWQQYYDDTFFAHLTTNLSSLPKQYDERSISSSMQGNIKNTWNL